MPSTILPECPQGQARACFILLGVRACCIVPASAAAPCLCTADELSSSIAWKHAPCGRYTPARMLTLLLPHRAYSSCMVTRPAYGHHSERLCTQRTPLCKPCAPCINAATVIALLHVPAFHNNMPHKGILCASSSEHARCMLWLRSFTERTPVGFLLSPHSPSFVLCILHALTVMPYAFCHRTRSNLWRTCPALRFACSLHTYACDGLPRALLIDLIHVVRTVAAALPGM